MRAYFITWFKKYVFWNYLKISFRNIKRYKIHSVINIAGLAIGICCCILILLWIQDELSFDRFHVNVSRIFRVAKEEHRTEEIELSARTPPPLAKALVRDIPEIEMATRYGRWENRNISFGGKNFNESDYWHADADFFEIFSFSFLKGDPRTVFVNPYSVVITEETAIRYFGEENPIGEILTVNNGFQVTVTGVLHNIPDNSTLQFDLISPFEILITEFTGEESRDNWHFNSFTTFVLLRDQASANIVDEKITEYLFAQIEKNSDYLFLQPITDVHLRSRLTLDFTGRGSIKYIWIFSGLALFILIIACINFMNLTTARSSQRAKEVGLRKVVGASRSQLARQFFGESTLLAIIALLIALVLVELVMPEFNRITEKSLSLKILQDPIIIVGAFLLILFTGILSGFYPALMLSSFQPAKALKDNKIPAGTRTVLMRILVTAQFSISIFLIIGTFIIIRQLLYMEHKDLGIEKDHILNIELIGELNQQYPSLKEEICRLNNVINVSASLALPSDIASSPGSPEWEGKDPNNQMQIKADFVDYDYIETFDITMKQGRSFSRLYSTDDSAAYVVNEEAVRRMGLESPIDKSFSFWEIEGRIIGVMKDFHFRSLHNKIEPIVFKIFPPWFRYMYIKIDSKNIQSTICDIEATWTKMVPEYPFEFSFLEEEFDNVYKSERRLGKLFYYFAALAVFIACLGMLGLSSLIAEQRTKEIGIRKILGASMSSIFILFSKEFTKWIVLANVIAWPIAYYSMLKWLQGFAYRIDMTLEFYIIAGIIALVIALLTVSYQSLKSALINPAISLRYE